MSDESHDRPPGGDDPPAASADETMVEHLSTTECWRLLEQGKLGRLAVVSRAGAPDVFPVNYLVHNGTVIIRSAAGAKISALTARPGVAFEIDGDSAASRWSVVIRGHAGVLDVDADIDEAGQLKIASWHPTVKTVFIRVTPQTVTGRRFRRRLPDVRQAPTAPLERVARRAESEPEMRDGAARSARPTSIPHLEPYRDG